MWTADGQFQPPAAYRGRLTGLYGFSGQQVHSTSRSRLRLSFNQLMRIVVPTVHASASATAGGTVVESPKTTVDTMAEKRPNIVITDEDIQAVLDKETGHDRLRVMFTKE